MVLILNAATVIARNNVTKQSKMRDCFTEPALNKVNVFAMTIQHYGNTLASYRELPSQN